MPATTATVTITHETAPNALLNQPVDVPVGETTLTGRFVAELAHYETTVSGWFLVEGQMWAGLVELPYGTVLTPHPAS